MIRLLVHSAIAGTVALAFASPSFADEPKPSTPADFLAQAQGKWTRSVKSEGKAYRVEKHITGNKETVSYYEGDKLVSRHNVEFTIAKTSDVMIFTFRNMKITAGPDEGKSYPEPYSYLFQIRDNKWMEVTNLMNGNSGTPAMAIYEHVKQ